MVCLHFFDFHAKPLATISKIYTAVAGFCRLCAVLEIPHLMEVMEQINYLLFIVRVGDLQTLEKNRANRTKKPITNQIFLGCTDSNAYEVGSCFYVPSGNSR